MHARTHARTHTLTHTHTHARKGYRNGNNGRVRNVEALIRKGVKAIPMKMNKKVVMDRSSYLRAFLKNYIFEHSQGSPADTKLYLDHIGNSELYNVYLNEINSKNKGGQPVGLAWFTKQFNKTLRDGVTDSETGVRYQTYIMKSSAKGFSACNFCKYIQMRMSGTSNLAKRSAYQRKYQKHIDEVYADREELARIQRLCIVNPHHCGFFIDAADSNKFQLPTTKSTAKLLSQL